VLALTHVFERRVDREFSDQIGDAELPDAVVRTFRALLKDEQRHLDWIGRWLGERPALEASVDRYTTLDRDIASRLRPFRDCLWEVPGLGEELEELSLVSRQRGGIALNVFSMFSSTASVERTPTSR
jgi:hypothetical protein